MIKLPEHVEPKTMDQIYEEVAEMLNLPVKVVARTYRAFFKFVKAKAQEQPFKIDHEYSKEEYLDIRPNINIPSVGKLNVTYRRYWGKRRQREYILKYLEERDRDKDSDDSIDLNNLEDTYGDSICGEETKADTELSEIERILEERLAEYNRTHNFDND